MMNTFGTKNHLIIGSSSNIATKYISLIRKPGDYFYGVSSRADYFNNNFFEINVNYGEVRKISKINFDNIFIIASRNPRHGGSLSEFLEVNNLILDVLRSIKHTENGRMKVTFLSSFSVFDKNSQVIDDNTPVSPADYYGESKALLEDSLCDFSRNNDTSLLICRLPVFLYNGVSGRSSNFLARLALSTVSRSSFVLSNPHAYLSAVFNVESLVELATISMAGIQRVNCGAVPDITFREIGELAMELGLSRIYWQNTNRPSVQVCLNSIYRLLGFKPSAKNMVEMWMYDECRLK